MVSPFFTHVYLLPQPVTTPLTNPLFLYVTIKEANPKPFQFHFQPPYGFLCGSSPLYDG